MHMHLGVEHSSRHHYEEKVSVISSGITVEQASAFTSDLHRVSDESICSSPLSKLAIGERARPVGQQGYLTSGLEHMYSINTRDDSLKVGE